MGSCRAGFHEPRGCGLGSPTERERERRGEGLNTRVYGEAEGTPRLFSPSAACRTPHSSLTPRGGEEEGIRAEIQPISLGSQLGKAGREGEEKEDSTQVGSVLGFYRV